MQPIVLHIKKIKIKKTMRIYSGNNISDKRKLKENYYKDGGKFCFSTYHKDFT